MPRSQVGIAKDMSLHLTVCNQVVVSPRPMTFTCSASMNGIVLHINEHELAEMIHIQTL